MPGMGMFLRVIVSKSEDYHWKTLTLYMMKGSPIIMLFSHLPSVGAALFTLLVNLMSSMVQSGFLVDPVASVYQHSLVSML